MFVAKATGLIPVPAGVWTRPGVSFVKDRPSRRGNMHSTAVYRFHRFAATGILCVVLAIVAGGPAANESQSAVEKYRYVVSVGCAPPNGQTVAYVWHTAAATQVEGDRLFKELAAADFDECLSEIARTRPGLYELLVNLGPDSGREATHDVMDQATAAWAEFGVYEAMEEVASTGSRGPKVKALLNACDDLRKKRQGVAAMSSAGDAVKAPDQPASVTFVVRLCEGQIVEPVIGDDVEAREKDCLKPLTRVPVWVGTGDVASNEINTDGAGVATVGPLLLLASQSVTVHTGCTTHNCMTLHLAGIAGGDVHAGINRVLVFAVPKTGFLKKG
jgi:hypothetical protein